MGKLSLVLIRGRSFVEQQSFEDKVCITLCAVVNIIKLILSLFSLSPERKGSHVKCYFHT